MCTPISVYGIGLLFKGVTFCCRDAHLKPCTSKQSPIFQQPEFSATWNCQNKQAAVMAASTSAVFLQWFIEFSCISESGAVLHYTGGSFLCQPTHLHVFYAKYQQCCRNFRSISTCIRQHFSIFHEPIMNTQILNGQLKLIGEYTFLY